MTFEREAVLLFVLCMPSVKRLKSVRKEIESIERSAL